MQRIGLMTQLGEPLETMTTAEKGPGRKLIEDLQLDKTLLILCPATASRQALLDALCMPSASVEDIQFRYRVQDVFHTHPTLLEGLSILCRRLNQTKNAWDSDRSKLFAHRRADPSNLSLQLSVNRDMLALTCMYLRSTVAQIREISILLQEYPDAAAVLTTLVEACDRVWHGHTELLEFADRCQRMLHQATRYEIEVFLDKKLQMDSFLMQDFAYLRTTPQNQKEKGGLMQLFSRQKKEPVAKSAPMPEVGRSFGVLTQGTRWEITCEGVQECDRLLTAMLRGLLDRFSPLEGDLSFYEGTLLFRQALEDKGIRPIFPEITPSSTGTITMTELYDLLLLSSMPKERVVPNDVSLNCEGKPGTTERTTLVGMLIHGENNSGKTVFLRSVGCAILLAQCGLPIPASSGSISVRRRLYTQFATAEGALVRGSVAGRFEEEAAALAQMLDEMEPDSLLLLNETFQTTAYGEGAAGIEPILHYIGHCGCAFVFVTHLTSLLTSLRGQVVIAKTSDDPRTPYQVTIE